LTTAHEFRICWLMGYLRLFVVKRITVIKFGVNDGVGNGTGCGGIEIRTDTARLMNVIITGITDCEIKFGLKR